MFFSSLALLSPASFADKVDKLRAQKQSFRRLDATKNIFSKNQNGYGNWEPDAFLAKGWTGYQVVTQVFKLKPYVKYSHDDSTYYHEQCPDGDCQFEKKSSIFSIIGNGKQAPKKTLIGTFFSSDSGSVEKMELKTASNINIAVIDEVEAQSRLKFDEAQIATLTGFTKSGQAVELGHIEESDPPGRVNQPESVYKRVGDEDQFVTTVVERINWFLGDPAKENIRYETLWCNSNEYKLDVGIVKKFRNDSFDLRKCGMDNMPIISNPKNGNPVDFAKQWMTGRSSSLVSVQNPETREHDLQYEANSDIDFPLNLHWLKEGTRYKLIYGSKDEKRNIAFFSSERYASMGNTGLPPDEYKNIPKVKFLTIDAQGVDRLDEAEWSDSKKSAALVSYEKLNEVQVGTNGSHCTVDEHNDGVYVNERINNLKKGIGPSSTRKENKLSFALACKAGYRYTLSMYIMFPPKIDMAKKSVTELFEKVSVLDQVLAAMPDQTQSSRELVVAEESLDAIKIFEIFNQTKDPTSIKFDHLMDLATEEDHTTAQNKIWDFFSNLGLVQKRKNYVEYQLPSVSESQDSGEIYYGDAEEDDDEL